MALPMFGTVIPVTVTTPTNQRLTLALGITSLVILTGTTNIAFCGLACTTGSIDGMVVALQNVNNTSIAYGFNHEDTTNEPVAANRFRNAGLANIGGNTNGTVWYRYLGSISRWQQIGRT